MTDAPEDFDWTSDESIAVREQPAVAVYLNNNGQVVLRRERSWNEEDDCFIPIAQANVLTVIGAILRTAGMEDVELIRCKGGSPHFATYEDVELPEPVSVGSEQQNDNQQSAPKDRTAAERQRRHRGKLKRDLLPNVTAVTRDIGDELPLRMTAGE